TNLMDYIVTECHIAEYSRRSRFLELSFNGGIDLLRNHKMVRIGLTIDKIRPIKIASGRPLTSRERTEDHETCVLRVIFTHVGAKQCVDFSFLPIGIALGFLKRWEVAYVRGACLSRFFDSHCPPLYQASPSIRLQIHSRARRGRFLCHSALKAFSQDLIFALRFLGDLCILCGESKPQIS